MQSIQEKLQGNNQPRYITDVFLTWENSADKRKRAVAKYLNRDLTSVLTDGKVWWTERTPLPNCHFRIIRSYMMQEHHCPYLYEKVQMKQCDIT